MLGKDLFYEIISNVFISQEGEKYYMYGGYTPIGRDWIEISKETFDSLLKDLNK